MNFLEKNLEQIIIETPNEKLQERGLYISGKKFSQITVGEYGRFDVVTIEKGYDEDLYHYRNIIEPVLTVTVYELKKEVIDGSTMFQAMGYVKGIQRYFNKLDKFRRIRVEYRIVLIGKEISLNNGFCFAPNIFYNITLLTYSYEFDGIKFNDDCDFHLINAGF